MPLEQREWTLDGFWYCSWSSLALLSYAITDGVFEVSFQTFLSPSINAFLWLLLLFLLWEKLYFSYFCVVVEQYKIMEKSQRSEQLWKKRQFLETIPTENINCDMIKLFSCVYAFPSFHIIFLLFCVCTLVLFQFLYSSFRWQI